jgi:hypothetical protein
MLSYRAQTAMLRGTFLVLRWVSGVGCRVSEMVDARKQSLALHDLRGSPVG